VGVPLKYGSVCSGIEAASVAWEPLGWKPASECPDGPRYKALGNSMAVPCMAWIGSRINRQLEGQP
jgi:site-specific DNA-cytosine methylase